jgi:hypothetical protein
MPVKHSINKAPQSATPDASELELDSLFLVSLPRSLSTVLYHSIRRAVGLREPVWTSDGEILNLDRFALFQGSPHDSNRKFTSPTLEPGLFHATTEFLDQLAAPVGYAYKDVVQPFVVAEWLKRRGFLAIRIKRNVADVAYSMLNAGWLYPARLFPETDDFEMLVVRGLMQAEQVLASIPAYCLDFDELIFDAQPLWAVLRELYPGRKIRPIQFIDHEFKQMRRQILERRRTEKHQALTDEVAKYSSPAVDIAW